MAAIYCKRQVGNISCQLHNAFVIIFHLYIQLTMKIVLILRFWARKLTSCAEGPYLTPSWISWNVC
jgi:hypothetical protein